MKKWLVFYQSNPECMRIFENLKLSYNSAMDIELVLVIPNLFAFYYYYYLFEKWNQNNFEKLKDSNK